jgi:hypothetical protein
VSISWPHANRIDQRKLFSIKRLLIDHPDLVKFIFHIKEPKLRLPVDEILLSTRGLSHGELLLVMLSLDIWNGSGETNIREMLDVWDQRSWSHFIASLGILLMDQEGDPEEILNEHYRS